MTGMNTVSIFFGCAMLVLSLGTSNRAHGEDVKEPAVSEAQPIDANAALNENHPAIEEGVTCNDCHPKKS